MARLRASWRTSLPVAQQPRNPQSESIARTPYDEALYPARPPAAAAAVAGVGQSGWPQDTRPGAVAVRAWDHAALHARGRQLAQHGGVDRARAQAPGARRTTSA